jgi:hypothetical protein
MSDLTFRLYIDTANAAFCGDDGELDPAPELARLLRETARRLERDPEQWREHGFYQTIRDLNGNDVGRFGLKEKGRE